MSEKVSSQGSLKNTNFIPYEGRRKKAEKELENQII